MKRSGAVTTPPDHRARLYALAGGRGALEDALALFDSLPQVGLDEMTGSWRGKGLLTGHPLDGLLERYGWWGKRFAGPEAAHPLLFERPGGGVLDINPAFAPIGLALRFPGLFKSGIAARLFKLLAPLLATKRPKARLRMTECRGVLSATMVYDALPVNDVFRKVDADTLLGLMDMRGMDRPFFFVLARER